MTNATLALGDPQLLQLIERVMADGGSPMMAAPAADRGELLHAPPAAWRSNRRVLLSNRIRRARFAMLRLPLLQYPIRWMAL